MNKTLQIHILYDLKLRILIEFKIHKSLKCIKQGNYITNSFHL